MSVVFKIFGDFKILKSKMADMIFSKKSSLMSFPRFFSIHFGIQDGGYEILEKMVMGVVFIVLRGANYENDINFGTNNGRHDVFEKIFMGVLMLLS